jgi:hypothetical protein
MVRAKAYSLPTHNSVTAHSQGDEEARTLDDMEADSNHRFKKSNSPDFSVGFDLRM